MNKIEEWERNAINALTLKLLFASTLGTLVAVAIGFILQKIELITEVRPELHFIPWGIALVLGVSIAFHQGVVAERARQELLDAGAMKEQEA